MSYSPNTDKLNNRFLGFLGAGRFLAGSLGNRLVFQILAISASLSIFTSGIQLFVGYQQDKEGLAAIATTVKNSHSSAFADALWEYNFELTSALLDGVYNKENVEHVSLKTPQGREWELGAAQEGHSVATLEFSYRDGTRPPQLVGTLNIGISDAEVIQRLWEQAWVVLATNFLKASLVSIAISVLFEWNVGRHLNRIAQHVSRSNWQDSDVRIELDRSRRNSDEDIEVVVDAICSARQRAHDDFVRLKEEIERRTQAERDLQYRQDELEQAYREQSEFTYAVSHDMKSPTNTIKLVTQDLRGCLEHVDDQDVEEILDDLDKTVGRMSSLIDDVLHYASSVNEAPDIEDVPLNAVVEEIVSDLKGDIRASEAQIVVEGLPTIKGNRSQLRLLLQNLVSNALKFRSADRQPIVRIESREKDGNKSVRVSDNGIGISEEHFERIFGMFKRLHAQSEYEGTGLGLTLCKRIALNHNAQIDVISEVGKGTTFEVTFRGSENARNQNKLGDAH